MSPSVIVSYAGLPETDAIANALERPDEIERGNAVEDQEAMRRWVRMTRIVGAREAIEEERRLFLDPNSYVASQAYAKQIRAAGANGVAYPSVRHAGGQCIGAFRPRAVGVPHQERHLKYRWNGERVDRYFDYARDEWIGR